MPNFEALRKQYSCILAEISRYKIGKTMAISFIKNFNFSTIAYDPR